MLAAYKDGDRDAALSGLRQLTANGDPARVVDKWLSRARRARDGAALELALLVQTEAAFDGYGEGLTLGLRNWLSQLAIIRRIFRALRSLDDRTPFLRNWYLLWESHLQGLGLALIPQSGDYLPFALADFPDDPEVLLTAACRHELLWWRRMSNPRRLPSGSGAPNTDLRTTVDLLRRSLEADPASVESRLRLGRVLFLLGDLESAEPELRRSTSLAVEPGHRYLGLLFLGEWFERRGNHDEAIRTYGSAIGLVSVDQSARLAAAQLAHKDGRRSEAAEETSRALTRPPTGSDPWWLYLSGQGWRFEQRLSVAQGIVRR